MVSDLVLEKYAELGRRRSSVLARVMVATASERRYEGCSRRLPSKAVVNTTYSIFYVPVSRAAADQRSQSLWCSRPSLSGNVSIKQLDSPEASKTFHRPMCCLQVKMDYEGVVVRPEEPTEPRGPGLGSQEVVNGAYPSPHNRRKLPVMVVRGWVLAQLEVSYFIPPDRSVANVPRQCTNFLRLTPESRL